MNCLSSSINENSGNSVELENQLRFDVELDKLLRSSKSLSKTFRALCNKVLCSSKLAKDD